MSTEGEDQMIRWLTVPGAMEADLAADRQRMIEEWNADPYFPIRNLRAHGTEPSEAALNTLDGPCFCERCGAPDHEDGDAMHPAETICYGCGHVTCDRPSCNTPDDFIGKHPFSFHGSAVAT